MTLVDSIDFTSLFVCVLVLFLIIRNNKIFDGLTITFLSISLIIITLVFISNCIEDFNPAFKLDQYEDFLEILIVPLLVFSLYSFSLNRELKKRKSAEELLKEKSVQLSYALEGAGEGLWDWNTNDNTFYFNAEFYKVLGYKPFSFPADKEHLVRLIHPDHLKAEDEYMTSFFNGIPDSRSLELMLLSADDTYKWMMLRGKTVKRNKDGSPARISGILLDISRLKKVEGELIQAKEKAETSDSLKSAFLANMSHDIRTPLNGILGFSELLRADDLTRKKQLEYFTFINQNGHHLLNLINDIIEISKIESNEISLNLSDFNLNILLEEIFTFYRTTQNDKIKDLTFSYSPGLSDSESVIISDKTRIRQVLINLIDNALRYTDEGYVKFGYVLNNKGLLVLFVEDSGLGISKDDQRIIFERFMQASHGDNSRRGTGLGLAICRGLINMLEGDIWVESNPDKGSKFSFSIPYKPGKNVIQSSAEKIPDSINFTNKKLLLVEDNPTSMIFLEEVLGSTGATLLKASTGNSAFDILSQHDDIDVILIDIQLPDVSGHEIVRHIRKTDTTIPVIAQTAYASDAEREKALESGFTDFMAKPINPAYLRKMIRRYL